MYLHVSCASSWRGRWWRRRRDRYLASGVCVECAGGEQEDFGERQGKRAPVVTVTAGMNYITRFFWFKDPVVRCKNSKRCASILLSEEQRQRWRREGQKAKCVFLGYIWSYNNQDINNQSIRPASFCLSQQNMEEISFHALHVCMWDVYPILPWDQ